MKKVKIYGRWVATTTCLTYGNGSVWYMTKLGHSGWTTTENVK